jgi:hypothetical protein
MVRGGRTERPPRFETKLWAGVVLDPLTLLLSLLSLLLGRLVLFFGLLFGLLHLLQRLLLLLLGLVVAVVGRKATAGQVRWGLREWQAGRAAGRRGYGRVREAHRCGIQHRSCRIGSRDVEERQHGDRRCASEN